MHSNISNNSRLIAQQPGKYIIKASVVWQAGASATGYRFAKIRKNQTTDLGSSELEGSTAADITNVVVVTAVSLV